MLLWKGNITFVYFILYRFLVSSYNTWAIKIMLSIKMFPFFILIKQKGLKLTEKVAFAFDELLQSWPIVLCASNILFISII